MQYSFIFAILAVTISISALPLNINLGAYSPALVVGDGEISFGGAESAQNIVSTLAAAGAEGSSTAATATTAKEVAPPISSTSSSTSSSATPTSTLSSGLGIGKKTVEPRIAETDVVVDERDAIKERDIIEERDEELVDRDIENILVERDLPEGDVEEFLVERDASEIAERDIATLNVALSYATNSLTNGPTVELGTGEGGSGVGITVSPKANAAAKAAKR